MALRRHETETVGNDIPVGERELAGMADMQCGSRPERSGDGETRGLSDTDVALARRLVRQHRAVYYYLADR